MIVSFIVAFAGYLVPIIGMIGLVIWIPAFSFYFYYAKRFGLELRRLDARDRAKPGAETQHMPSDQPPVVYLRSFDADNIAGRLKGQLTEEEHLARLLSHIGPVVAIGRPGETLPEAGARRIYVDDSEWQVTVERLMKSARLVALRTGLSKGLRWELDRAFEILSPERLLLVLDSKTDLNELLSEAKKVPPSSFRGIGWRSIVSIRAFVMFGADWRPSLLRARGTGILYKKNVFHTTTQARLAVTLRPLFKRLGVRWPRPAIGYAWIFYVAFCAGLTLWALFKGL